MPSPPRAALAAALALALASAAAGSLVVQKAERDVIIHMQVVDIRTRYTFKNEGKQPVDSVIVCTEPELANHLAFFEVLPPTDNGGTLPTTMVAVAGAPNGTMCVDVTLPTGIRAGESGGVDAFGSHVRAQTPKPATIGKGDPQRVKLAYSHVVVSPYAVKEQTTKLTLPDRAVEGYTPKPPSAVDGVTLTHGPYTNTPPLAHSPAWAHYVNNAPFVHAAVTREIEVSHWGNVATEEVYELEHAGAAASGEWSRADYDLSGRSSWPSALPGLRATLPPAARWLYFRDEIGNVSTSNVRASRTRVDAILRPRYPLMGGWRARFVFGHSLPLAAVAERLPKSRVRVTVPFGPSVEDVVCDTLATTIVLPEGARDIQHALPFGAAVARGVKKTYLDIGGRPTLTLTVTNAVAEHGVPLVVTYTLAAWRPWVEPLMVAAAVAACVAAALALSRVDASLDAPAGDAKAGAALAGRLSALLAERAAAVDALSSRASAPAAVAAAQAALNASAAKLKALLASGDAAGDARDAAARAVAAAELKVQAAAADVAAARAAGAGGDREAAAEARLAAARKAAGAAVAELMKLC